MDTLARESTTSDPAVGHQPQPPARGADAGDAVDYAELAKAHLTPVLGRYFERSWSHGIGHRLFDTAGNSYLDFGNGIAVSVLGHRHPRVTAAIHAQVDDLIAPTAAMGYAGSVVRLADMLAEELPDPIDTVFFLNSGSEAIEAAIKLARRVTGRPAIIAFRGAFHGRTMGAASLTSSNPNYRAGYEPFLPGVYLTPYPNAYRDFGGDEAAATESALASLRSLTALVVPPESVAAIFIEPVQGEGGYIPAPLAFLQALRAFCDAHGILLVADEVQAGYGRTGRMWSFEHAAIVPDVVCIAKAIANGLPLSAIASRRDLQDRWGKSAHGTTFGGNPVACAAGVAVLETIRDERLVENAAVRGERLLAGLRRLQARDERIGDVRGRGLMIGVEFVRDRGTRQPDGATCETVIELCANEGLLVLSCGTEHNVVRWIPPLDVTAEEIAEGLEIFGRVLRSIPTDPEAAGS